MLEARSYHYFSFRGNWWSIFWWFGLHFDQTHNCYSFIDDMLCNLKKREKMVFNVFKRKWWTEKGNISSGIFFMEYSSRSNKSVEKYWILFNSSVLVVTLLLCTYLHILWDKANTYVNVLGNHVFSPKSIRTSCSVKFELEFMIIFSKNVLLSIEKGNNKHS